MVWDPQEVRIPGVQNPPMAGILRSPPGTSSRRECRLVASGLSGPAFHQADATLEQHADAGVDDDCQLNSRAADETYAP